MIQKKIWSALFLTIALAFMPSLEAATELRMNAAGDLEIINAKGDLVKILSNGSISQSIKTDNQAFKVSYGKDLKGRFTTIVYPEPEKPQTISLNVFKQNVEISSDAVLTIIAEKDLTSATLQSGVLGKISVGGSELAAGNRVQIQNGAIVAEAPVLPAPSEAEATPTAPTEPAAVASVPAKATEPAPAVVSSEPKTLQPPANYQGGKTRKVEGDVLIAPKGQDVVEAIKNSPVPPRLAVNQTVTPGSTIQTGPTGKAYVSPFPGAVIMIEPNSTVSFDELAWRNKNGQVERKLSANVKEGSVISAIKGIDPKELDYRVKTPHGVAAARGTVYIVRNEKTKTTITVTQGKVLVETAQGSYTISVDSGNKIVIPIIGPDGEIPSAANGADITAAEKLLAEIQSYLGINDFGSPLPGEGGTTGSTPTLDALVDSFQSSFQPDLNPAPMTPTTSP